MIFWRSVANGKITENEADVYVAIRMDSQTNAYTIDMDLQQKHRRHGSLGTFKQHSLSPPLLGPQQGIVGMNFVQNIQSVDK